MMIYEAYVGNLSKFRKTGLSCSYCGKGLVANIGNSLGDSTYVVCSGCRRVCVLPTVLRGGQLWFDSEAAVDMIRAASVLPSMAEITGSSIKDLEREVLKNATSGCPRKGSVVYCSFTEPTPDSMVDKHTEVANEPTGPGDNCPQNPP